MSRNNKHSIVGTITISMNSEPSRGESSKSIMYTVDTDVSKDENGEYEAMLDTTDVKIPLGIDTKKAEVHGVSSFLYALMNWTVGDSFEKVLKDKVNAFFAGRTYENSEYLLSAFLTSIVRAINAFVQDGQMRSEHDPEKIKKELLDTWHCGSNPDARIRQEKRKGNFVNVSIRLFEITTSVSFVDERIDGIETGEKMDWFFLESGKDE